MKKSDFANYACDNISNFTRHHADNVVKLFEEDSAKLLEWTLSNNLKTNSSKCHFIRKRKYYFTQAIDNINIESSACEKLIRN